MSANSFSSSSSSSRGRGGECFIQDQRSREPGDFYERVMTQSNKAMLGMFSNFDKTLKSNLRFSLNYKKMAVDVVEGMIHQIPQGWEKTQRETIAVLQEELQNAERRYSQGCKSSLTYERVVKYIEEHIRAAEKQIQVANKYEASAERDCQAVSGLWNKLTKKISMMSAKCKMGMLRILDLYRHQLPLFSLSAKLNEALEMMEKMATTGEQESQSSRKLGYYTMTGIQRQFNLLTGNIMKTINTIRG